MRLVLLAVLAVVAYWALKRWARGRPEERAPAQVSDLVQDPWCKTYISRDDAVERRIEGQRYFFCSEACAKRFESKILNRSD